MAIDFRVWYSQFKQLVDSRQIVLSEDISVTDSLAEFISEGLYIKTTIKRMSCSWKSGKMGKIMYYGVVRITFWNYKCLKQQFWFSIENCCSMFIVFWIFEYLNIDFNWCIIYTTNFKWNCCELFKKKKCTWTKNIASIVQPKYG